MFERFGRSNTALALVAIIQTVIYAILSAKSVAFAYDAPAQDRPIPFVLGALWLCFVAHLFGLWLALQSKNQPVTLAIIVVGCVAFRLSFLFSSPIQEVDIYRYSWDGAVARNGVSPFRYSPQRVITASADETGWTPELRKLVELRDADEGLNEVLTRVHFDELTTIYPPVSQVVFAFADLLTPRGVWISSRILILKSVIVAFDLGTLFVLARFLALLRFQQAWLIAYGWSPLVLKEFSNSGHLDAIAVFFVVAAMFAFAKSIPFSDTATVDSPEYRGTGYWRLLAALSIGLGTGAKLFPIVLLPMLVIVTAVRLGFWAGVKFSLVAIFVSCLVLAPMIIAGLQPPIDQFPKFDLTSTAEPPAPSYTDPVAAEAAPVAPDLVLESSNSGLTTFLSRWEMNDLLFMLLEENLRAPQANNRKHRDPWFVIMPVESREAIKACAVAVVGISESRVPFVLTRVISLLVFSIVSVLLAIRAARSGDMLAVAEAAFLTIAWFWLLSPTQNPWYWTWALPLIPFARSKLWLMLSGLILVYYLRFWLQYQFPDESVLSSGLNGARFFDFVVVWFEFCPFLIALMLLAMLRVLRRQS